MTTNNYYVELIAELREDVKWSEKIGMQKTALRLSVAADAIEELQAEAQRWQTETREWYTSYMELLPTRWISVDECLPEDDEDVLVFFVYGIAPIIGMEVDCYNHRIKRWTNMNRAVTHWMPLPEPPTDK